MIQPRSPSRRLFAFGLPRAAAGMAFLALAVLTFPGCQLGELIGGMIESERRQGNKTVTTEYDGLIGKSFAVVVAADRLIQADNPEIVARLTVGIAERLAKEAGASGYVPGKSVLEYQYNHPRWVTMSLSQLARQLEVDRIVYIDLTEYRLNDAGNQYLWSGLAAGMVGVVEADSALDNEFIFQKQIRVKFPDKEGLGPADLPRAAVNTELANRFANRASWFFFTHEEKYYGDY